MDFLNLTPYNSFKCLYSKQDLQSQSTLLPILFAREYNRGYNSFIPTYNPFAPYRPQATRKLADVLSVHGDIYRGLFLRNEIIPMLKMYQLPGHTMFPITYNYRGVEKNDFTFFYIHENLLQNISFKESQFSVMTSTQFGSKPAQETILIEDIEHWHRLKRVSNTRIIPQKIILKETASFDLFGLFGLTFEIYISVKMYDKLKDKILGLDVREMDFSIEFQ